MLPWLSFTLRCQTLLPETTFLHSLYRPPWPRRFSFNRLANCSADHRHFDSDDACDTRGVLPLGDKRRA